MKLPIKLKYFTIDRGTVAPTSKDDIEFEGYVCLDPEGIQVAAGTSLAALISHGTNLDIQYECQEQWVARKLPTFDHLDGVDIDAPPDRAISLMLPGLGAPGGGQGGGDGFH